MNHCRASSIMIMPILVVALLLTTKSGVSAFVHKPSLRVASHHHRHFSSKAGQVHSVNVLERSIQECKKSTELYKGNNNNDNNIDEESSSDNINNNVYGIQRGVPLLILALAWSVWSFSLPLEFRRAHFCFSDRCVEHPSANMCYDCVAFSAWTKDIVTYYQQGGGVQWDFSVDPESPFLIK